MNINDELKDLNEEIKVKRKLDKVLHDLKEVKKELDSQVSELHETMLREENDVENLENNGLKSAFYGFLGKKEEKLEKERYEADVARDHYEDAYEELEDINHRIADLETKAKQFTNTEYRYQELIKEKENTLRSGNSAEAIKLRELDENLEGLANEKREINEAINAGKDAYNTVQDIIKCLDGAGTWGMIDMFSDSFFVDFAKHSQLDQAQQLTNELQYKLKRFEDELDDITIDTHLQISIDGFTRFADYWFDNVFIDWAVMDHIRDSQAKIKRVEQQIVDTLKKLKGMSVAADQLIVKFKQERDEIIANAQLQLKQ